MPTVQVAYTPGAGRDYVTLTSWAGSIAFGVTPVAGDQIDFPTTISVDATGVITGPDGTYDVYLIQQDGTMTGVSHQVGTGVVATLTNPLGLADGETAATGAVDTDTGEGLLYFQATENATEDDEDVVANGESQAVTETGTQSVSVSGLADGTTYYLHYVQVTDGNNSNVASSDSFTTDVAPEYPQSVTRTVTYGPGPGWAYVTLVSGFEPDLFADWNTQPVVGDQIEYQSADLELNNLAQIVALNSEATDIQIGLITQSGMYYLTTMDASGLPEKPDALVVIDSITTTRNSATVNFSYAGTVVTGFEYRLDDGLWVATSNPAQITGLNATTTFDFDIRPVNNGTPGEITSTTFTTDASTDATPNVFSFTALTNQARSFQVISDAITVSGVDAGVDVPVSVTGGEWSRSTDGGQTWEAWTTANGNARLNHRIRLRHTTSDEYSSGGYDGVRTTSLNAGGTTADFVSTTLPDTTAPVISLTAGNLDWTQGEPWVEPGYEVIDNADGDITVSGTDVIGTIDVNALGPQQILYRATDLSGNVSEATRTVTVVEEAQTDTAGPVIQLVGGNQTLTVGETWEEPGFSIFDEVDGAIPNSAATITGTVNAAQAGPYTLTYSAPDAAGNIGTATRTVTVLPATQYPLTALAPDSRTYTATRVFRIERGEKGFFKQPGEILDFDFDLTDWLELQGDDLSEDALIAADDLDLVGQGKVPGTDRVKVWISGGTDTYTYPVTLTVTTTGGRKAIFRFRLLVLDRMAA